MAREEITTVTYFDDITGEKLNDADIVVRRFAINNTAYIIDLSEESAREFDETLAPYIKAARVDNTQTQRGRRTRTSTSNTNWKAVRTWANDNNIAVSERGRVASDIVDAYTSRNADDIAALQEKYPVDVQHDTTEAADTTQTDTAQADTAQTDTAQPEFTSANTTDDTETAATDN